MSDSLVTFLIVLGLTLVLTGATVIAFRLRQMEYHLKFAHATMDVMEKSLAQVTTHLIEEMGKNVTLEEENLALHAVTVRLRGASAAASALDVEDTERAAAESAIIGEQLATQLRKDIADDLFAVADATDERKV